MQATQKQNTSNVVPTLKTYKCFLCETEYKGKQFEYYSKDYCSNVCCAAQRQADLEEEDRKAKECEKIKKIG